MKERIHSLIHSSFIILPKISKTVLGLRPISVWTIFSHPSALARSIIAEIFKIVFAKAGLLSQITYCPDFSSRTMNIEILLINLLHNLSIKSNQINQVPFLMYVQLSKAFFPFFTGTERAGGSSWNW